MGILNKPSRLIGIKNNNINYFKIAKYVKPTPLNSVSLNERQTLFLMDMPKNSSNDIQITNLEARIKMDNQIEKIDKNWGPRSIENFLKVKFSFYFLCFFY